MTDARRTPEPAPPRDEAPPYERPLDDDDADPNLDPPAWYSRVWNRERLDVTGDRDD